MTERLAGLAQAWRDEAGSLARRGADVLSRCLESCAADLEAAIVAEGAVAMTLAEAAARCGYSADALGRLIRQGRLRNVGRKHAPRVLLSELPLKPIAARGLNPHLGFASRQAARQPPIAEGSAK